MLNNKSHVINVKNFVNESINVLYHEVMKVCHTILYSLYIRELLTLLISDLKTYDALVEFISSFSSYRKNLKWIPK